jgi:hypothetical protein
MATGTSSRAPSPAFHTVDLEQATEYRSFSVSAIIAVVLGLASPLCFGAPLLSLIPIAGIAVSIFALRRIAASDGALAGRWAAVMGLILSAALVVAPVSRGLVLRSMRSQQSREFATSWLTLVTSGHSDEAFRLTLDSTRGSAPVEPGEKAAPENPKDRFLGQPQVKALAAAGADAEIRFAGTLAYDPERFPLVYVRQKFQVVPKATNSDVHPVDVALTLQRARLPKEGRSRWIVWSIDDGSKPATTPGASQ